MLTMNFERKKICESIKETRLNLLMLYFFQLQKRKKQAGLRQEDKAKNVHTTSVHGYGSYYFTRYIVTNKFKFCFIEMMETG
jgi:hypothetical protein